MPRMKTPQMVLRLSDALRENLQKIGLPAKVAYGAIPGTRLHRFVVVCPSFKKLAHSERQDIVWRIAQQTLSREEQFFISMILTVTPEEAGEEAASRAAPGRRTRKAV